MNNRLLGTYLDLIRIGAALMVVVQHARLTGVGTGLPARDALTRLLYFVTGQGHAAVIAFFVISGYLVGGKLFYAGKPGFLGKYMLDRATRIYVVALPVVLISFATMHLSAALYGDAYRLRGSICAASPGDLLAMLGMMHQGMGWNNCFNGPIWSLTYEVFYYVFFALIAVGWARWREPLGWGCAALAVVVGGYGLLNPFPMLAMSTIWLVGMAVAQAEPLKQRGLAFTVLVLLLFALQAGLRFGHHRGVVTETLVTLAVAGGILILRRRTPFTLPAWVAVVASAGAAASYSIYLSHAPMLAFARGVVQGSFGMPMGPAHLTATTVALWGVLTVLGVAAGIAIWWLFERHTQAIRVRVERALGVPEAANHQPIPAEGVAAGGAFR